MPLFRRRNAQPRPDRPDDHRGEALEERLVARRAELLGEPAADVPEQFTQLLEELGLEYERRVDEMWFVNLGKLWVTVAWIADESVLGMITMYAEPPGLSMALLLRNADGHLTWNSVGDDDDGSQIVLARASLPMDGLDRQAAIAGLEAAAFEAESDEMGRRLGKSLDTPCDVAEQLERALGELSLESAPADHGAQTVETDFGPLRLDVVRGESVGVWLELDRSQDPENEQMAWWMLQLSDGAARVSISPLEGDQWIVSAHAVVAARPLAAQALALNIVRVLGLARQFARLS